MKINSTMNKYNHIQHVLQSHPIIGHSNKGRNEVILMAVNVYWNGCPVLPLIILLGFFRPQFTFLGELETRKRLLVIPVRLELWRMDKGQAPR